MFRTYANPDRFEGSELTITEFPNPILRAANAEVTLFDHKLAQLCAEFFAVQYGANGVGLAAPQVGLNMQLFVYNVDPGAPGALKKLGERVVCNPRILEYGPATDVEVEGCLSSRSECCVGDICRATSLSVAYQDERGRMKEKRLRGFEARVFQHEYDHLQGVLHIDRQSQLDRANIQPYLDALVELHGPGGALALPEGVASGLQPPLGAATPPARPAGAAGSAAAKPKPKGKVAGGAPPAAATAAGFGGAGGGAAAGGVGSRKAKLKKKKR